jgi:hypothetical protein
MRKTKPFKNVYKYINILFLFAISSFTLFFLYPEFTTNAAKVLDNSAGTYTDDFGDNTGVPTRSYVNVNTAIGKLQLTSAASQTTFTAPYAASGNAITSVIKPLLIAKWDKLIIDATVPEGTTLKVQILSDNNTIWNNEYLPGNEEGLDVNTEINLETISIHKCPRKPDDPLGLNWGCSKFTSIKIRFLMTTTDTSITPTVDNLSLSWITTQDPSNTNLFDEGGWRFSSGNQQNTRQSSFYNPEVYSTFKWVSEKLHFDPYYYSLYNFNNKLIGITLNSYGRIFALDETTGQKIWETEGDYLYHGSISKDGTYYTNNSNVDSVVAVDLNDGEIRWVYNWMDGHGHKVLIGNNSIHYTRDTGSSPSIKLIEQGFDGTIIRNLDLTVIPEGLVSEIKSINQLVFNNEEKVGYSIIRVTNSSTYAVNTSKSRLVAIDLLTGELMWSFLGEYSDPIVGKDDTVYVSTITNNAWIQGKPVKEDKILALNPDGSVKWELNNPNSSDSNYTGKLSLTNQNVLLAIRKDPENANPLSIQFIDALNGTLLRTMQLQTFSYLDYYDLLFSDNNSGYYLKNDLYLNGDEESCDWNWKCNVEEQILYYDREGSFKWKLKIYYDNFDLNGNYYGHYLSTLIPGENGISYGSFSYDFSQNGRVPSETYAQTYALQPWTLSLVNTKDSYRPGEIVTFKVNSTMKTTNLLFGGDNKVQVVINNHKVPLTYVSTDSNDNTEWTGIYTIPTAQKDGDLGFKIEASQAYFETDLQTQFDEPALHTNNTGLVKSATIQITNDLPKVVITNIGSIKNIPVKDSLTYFFTTTTVNIKGTSEPNSKVFFVSNNNTYTSDTNSEGTYSIQLQLKKGSNGIEYYAKDALGNTSPSRTLKLVIGTENFPNWLLEKIGLLFNTDTNETPDSSDTDRQENQEHTKTITFVDSKGLPIPNARVVINSIEYITNSKGEIFTTDLEEESTYKATITYNGKEYTTDILGVSESVVLDIEQTNKGPVVVEEKNKNIYIYVGVGILLIGVILYIISKSRNKETF